MSRVFATVLLACALCVPSVAGAASGALDTFRQAHERVIALVDKQAKDAALEAEVDALLDYAWLTRAALGGSAHYAERCATRCAEFESLLSELIRVNYLRRLADAGRGQVAYLGEEAGSSATKVDTRISYRSGTKQRTLDVDYVLHEVDGRWQVRDIITEDVSLAKNYRYEINQLYRKGGIDQVIGALQARLDELEAG